MSELDPESAVAPGGYAAPGAGQPQPWPGPAQPWAGPPGTGYPGPYATPQPPPRRSRGPLIGFIVGVVVVALGAGGYAIAHTLSTSGNNKPIATSTRAVAGGTSISGHGITLTFPKGWDNVPTSPNDFEHFIKVFESKYGHVPAALQSEMSNPQLLHSFAMLVYKFGSNGSVAENLNALVTPAVATPSQMMTQLKSGQGPAQFGARNIQYRITNFATHPSLLVTYTVSTQGRSFSGAQAYVDGPASMAVVTVTSSSPATSENDLKQIVGTIKFS